MHLSNAAWKNLNSRGSRPEVFYKKGVLRNFAKFSGKHLCQSLFFNKVAGLSIPHENIRKPRHIDKPATLLKRDSGILVYR